MYNGRRSQMITCHNKQKKNSVFVSFFWWSVFVFQISRSGARRVVLQQATPAMAGRFRCEVSADAPTFHTEIRSAPLEVVGESTTIISLMNKLIIFYLSVIHSFRVNIRALEGRKSLNLRSDGSRNIFFQNKKSIAFQFQTTISI